MILKNVLLNNDQTGWEYIDIDGNMHDAVPSLAIWSWRSRSLISSDFKIRRSGRQEWHRLKERFKEISTEARFQLSKYVFEGFNWYFLNVDKVQGPYGLEAMMEYLANGTITEFTMVLSAKIPNGKKPDDKKKFKKLGDLIDKIQDSRIKHFKAKSEKNQDTVSNIEEKNMIENIITTKVDSNSVELPLISFEELKIIAGPALFSSKYVMWYLKHSDVIYGPYYNKDIKYIFMDMLPGHLLCPVRKEDHIPEDSMFSTLESRLKKVYEALKEKDILESMTDLILSKKEF